MAQSYFEDFWLFTTSGEKLFPARILDKDTGRATFRALARGNNEKANGRQFDDPVEAIKAFLSGKALRFGAPGVPDNRFYHDGPQTAKLGATPGFRAAHPNLRF